MNNALKSLAERAANIEGRQAVRLAEVHGRIQAVRRRRTLGAAVAVLALVVGTAGGVALLTESDERPPEIVNTPTPTPTPVPFPEPSPEPRPGSVESLSPREVVTADNAELLHAAVSAENPDVRISIWEAVCELCPIPFESQLHPSFKGMALTTDGYRTTNYTRSPLRQGPPYRIESLPGSFFLLVDDANGQEVLVDIDGTIRRVERVGTPISSPNAHWFECLSIPFATSPLTWCALDPATATAYPVRPTYSEPPVDPPGTTDLSWGVESTYPRGNIIWWENSGGRQEVEILVPANSRRGILTGGPPALWVIDKRSKSLELQVVDLESGRLEKITRPAPEPTGGNFQFVVTPEGGLVAAETYSESAGPVPQIWRAPSLTADFEMVFDEALADQPVDIDEGGLRVVGDRIYVGAMGIVESFDDGRTWSTTSTWR